MSLLVLERGMDGFERGRNLEKIGMHAQDTAELFFDDVRVPVENRLGEEGTGFVSLVTNLPQERLSIAVTAVAAAQAAFERTLDYAKERTAFGQPIASFQHNRFVLAEMATEIEIAQTFVDRCVLALNAGELTADEAAMAKWWCTELQGRVVDRGVQLHGGYGYMTEYSDRPRLRRRPHHPYLRRHDRDHEGDHRQVAGHLTPCRLARLADAPGRSGAALTVAFAGSAAADDQAASRVMMRSDERTRRVQRRRRAVALLARRRCWPPRLGVAGARGRRSPRTPCRSRPCSRACSPATW